MSTLILFAARTSPDRDEARVQEGFRLAQAFVEESEKRFTRFSEDSELSALNRSAGKWFDASADLFEVMALAQHLHQQTGGLFDPAVLPALEAAGYDRTIDEVRSPSNAMKSAVARVQKSGLGFEGKRPTFAGVELDEIGRRIRLPVGMRVDLGGIAKGWIAEQAAQVLARNTNNCAVDAGGDMFLVGFPEENPYWRVTLEDPQNPDRGLAILKIKPGAVATSSITKRRWESAGKTQHHLIDPRTRQPADTQWLSVTVTAPHTPEAEVYAKSLLIGGAVEADRIAEMDASMEYIAVDRQGKLWGSKHSREIFDV